MFYRNEHILGNALNKTDITREELFITTKLWNSDHGYDQTKKAFEKSLKKLQLDYVDCYLIHWPSKKYMESWKAMEEIYAAGKAKSIGVSNFTLEHLEDILAHGSVVPAVNQIEIHPYFQQNEMIDFLTKHNIAHEAWSPLGAGNKGLFEEPTLKALAEKYHKNIGQIILRWHLQRNTIVIPKSSNQKRLESNIDLWDFALEQTDMEAIAKLDKDKRTGPNPHNKFFLWFTTFLKG